MTGSSDSPRRESYDEGIEDLEKIENLELYMGETDISVSFTSFMAAVVFFFIGLLLTGNPELQFRLRIPLIFLFLSALGFLYSTIIYANASGELSRLKKHSFDKQISVGNIISEYFGVYCLIFAIPITLLGYSPDRVLATTILVLSGTGFFMYHYLGYSILERYVSRPLSNYIVLLLLGLHVTSFYEFFEENIPAYYILSALLLVAIGVITIFSVKKSEVG